MTVDKLFIFHGKVSLFNEFMQRACDGACFLNAINNKLTVELLKK